MSLKEKINLEKLPYHIAVIMDGNGRWAYMHGQDRVFGHSNGVQAVRDTAEACAELGVKFLTLYTFSTENWNRPQSEVNALMSLLVSTIRSETETLMKNKIRLEAIGDLESLPESCRAELAEAMKITAGNDRMQLTLALSYSSRWEILRAVKTIVEDVQQQKLAPEAINEDCFGSYLTTTSIPDPELMIRTSGEHRVSNFLLWQIAYTEFHFTEKLWPEFNKEDLYLAILDYQKRERRYGLTSDQLKGPNA
jgi:undecaprenyl diphosphate synthase